MESSKYPDNTGPSPIQLPPIVEDIEAAGSSTGHLSPNSSKPLKMDPKPWSRYHAGCIKKDPNYMDWSSRQVRKNEKCKELQRVGPKELTLRRMDKADFKEFLENNRDMVEGYVLKRMSAKQLDKWLQKKLAESDVELMYIFDKVDNEDSLVWNLTQYITKTIGVDAYRVYRILYDKQHSVKCLSRQSDNEDTSKSWNLIWRTIQIDEKKLLFILDIAKKGTIRKLSDDNATSPFPTTSDFLINPVNLKKREANYLMYLPISTNGKTMYVLELWKMKNDYTVADKETCSNFVVWSRLAMKYCDLYLDKKRERIMTNFLLDVVKEIFEEMVSLDHLIKRILEFAQRLVNADRASLFLVDYKHFELVSTVFDLKFEKGAGADVEKKEIRLPINRGIAGHVALSGETMNIQDAYSDLRFNRAIDEATGYKTNNILCMPIKVQGKVIGVVQMVNKRNSTNFDLNDEVAFETFSTFFGLALHHARLYDRIMRKEQKYRVALEVLSYHNTCRENEVQAIINDNRQININLNDFYLDPYKFNELEKCKTVISMFNDLFDLTGFNITTFTRFVLTVKKNYRTVPYHNFDHGWAVANSMYTMLKTDIKVHFNYKQRLSLFVACLCHDLDHRGYTNKYMSETASPLAAMYSTSTLEHHHFNITVTILQQDGHNIFSHMESKEYKEVLSTIKHCILATDLAAFFPNLAKLQKLHEQSDTENAFSWTYTRHRELAMSLSMTAADLCASAKPWDIQIKTVEVIIEEFYDQGDKEKLAGITPIPMMDRSKPEEQAASQVGFLTSICVPCYDMLNRILPNTEPMYMMVLQNLEKWRARADNFNETKSYTVQTPELDIKEENKEKSENNDTFLENKSVLNCGNQVWDTIEAELWDDDDEIDDENEKKILISEIINCFDEIDWTDDEGGVGEQKPSTSHAN